MINIVMLYINSDGCKGVKSLLLGHVWDKGFAISISESTTEQQTSRLHEKKADGRERKSGL